MKDFLIPFTETMTDEQIDQAVDIFRSVLIENRGQLRSEPVQLVLGKSELGGELFKPFRRRVEALSGESIIRRVLVKEEMVEVVFHKLYKFLIDEDIQEWYDLRGIEPLEPDLLEWINREYPNLVSEYPNGVHYKDARDKWCFVSYKLWACRPGTVVSYDSQLCWDGSWFLAGRRKK